MRVEVSITGLLVFSLFGVVCRGTAPSGTKASTVVKNAPDVATSFRDTALATGITDAPTVELRTPRQRDALLATLRRERELWQANSPRDYQFLLRVGCFCPGNRGWLLMEVRKNRPLRAWDKTGKSAPLTDWNTFSVDGLFDMLEQAADTDGVVRVAFDPRWHFPANIRTVRLPGPDAWTLIDARSLRPLTNAP